MTEIRDIESLHGKFKTILAYMDAPVLIVSNNYKTAYINPAFETAFQTSFRDALGKDVAHYLPPSSVEVLVEAGEKVKDNGDRYRFKFQEGSQFHSVGVSPITDDNKRVTGIVYSFTDITKERELEKVKAEFISMLLNDLHAPLFDILEIFKRLEATSAPGDANLNFINVGSGKAQEVVDHLDRLLHITDSISGELRLTCVPCDMSLLVSSAVGSLEAKAEREQVTLHNFPSNLPTHSCDQDKVLQVIIHIINTQIMAAGQGSTVGITSYTDDEKSPRLVHIAVAQTGRTISADDLPEMLPADDERLQACDPGCLAVAKIVEAHGGRISLVGVEGMGSAVVLTLPAN